MTTLFDEIRELQEEIKRFQVALRFWLPCVPADGPEEIASRIGDDALLLVGLEDVPDERSAEERGWIRLSNSTTKQP
jgi:hypothetical protein